MYPGIPTYEESSEWGYIVYSACMKSMKSSWKQVGIYLSMYVNLNPFRSALLPAGTSGKADIYPPILQQNLNSFTFWYQISDTLDTLDPVRHERGHKSR